MKLCQSVSCIATPLEKDLKKVWPDDREILDGGDNPSPQMEETGYLYCPHCGLMYKDLGD